MTERLRVSIALATWNGERFLREQLESYLVQTQLPDELIVSDDHSRESTLDIVREFARTAPFEVRILENTQRVGYAENFAHAIEACQGDVILLSDQDDIWLPPHVEELVHPFEQDLQRSKEGREEELLLVLSRSRHFRIEPDGTRREWDIATSKIRKWNWALCQRDGLIAGFIRHRERPFAAHGIGFSRRLARLSLPFPSGCSDLESWLGSIASTIGKYLFIDEVLTLHRVHDRNAAGFGHRRRLVVPGAGSDPFRKEIARWQAFVERLVSMEGSLTERGRRSIQVAERAIRVLKRRSRARHLGWLGIPICLFVLLKGDYHRAALGMFSFARDVMDILRRPIVPGRSQLPLQHG